jgi:microcompartment protein CcmL/EutN
VADRSIGFIETFGLTAAIAAADAAVKAANVKLLGYEYAKGDGMCTVKVEGNVGACKAAIEAGKRAAELVQGTHQGTKSVLLKARPARDIIPTMINNRENVGGEIALAEGYRPKGESRMPVLVKDWKPKEEPKAETPIEEAPETPVVEDLKEETSEEKKN